MSDNHPLIVYVVSHVQKSMAFEWVAEALRKRYRVIFVLLNPGISALERFLVERGIEVKRIRFADKKDYPRAFLILLLLFLRRRPAIVHAHLLDAQLLGLTCAWLARVPKRIYTRHTSNYHHVYSHSGIRYDLWSNTLATHIISISQATDATLLNLEGVLQTKITKIPHGFHLAAFREVSAANIQMLKSRWGITDRHPRIGVIARHIQWKGVQHVIEAFSTLLADYPSALLMLANSHGPYHGQLLAQLKDLPPSSYILIPFEDDIVSLYAVLDVYVHVPVDAVCEAFGQTYVEALAAGVPSIFTRSGIADEFIEHNENALVVDFARPDQICDGIKVVLTDADLRQRITDGGRKSVEALFGFPRMMKDLEQLYDG